MESDVLLHNKQRSPSNRDEEARRKILSPLEAAVMLGHCNILVQLIKVRGGDTYMTLDRLMELASEAMKSGYQDVIAYLYILYHTQRRSFVDIDLSKPRRVAYHILAANDGLFNTASFHNDIATMKCVAYHFTEVYGYVHLAVRPGNDAFFEWLLENVMRVDEHILVRRGNQLFESTLLHQAILVDDWSLVCLLVRSGATTTQSIICDLFYPLGNDDLSYSFMDEVIPRERDVVAYMRFFHCVGFRNFITTRNLPEILRHSQGIRILEALDEIGVKFEATRLIDELFSVFTRSEISSEQTVRSYQLMPFIDFIKIPLKRLLLFDQRAADYSLERL